MNTGIDIILLIWWVMVSHYWMPIPPEIMQLTMSVLVCRPKHYFRSIVYVDIQIPLFYLYLPGLYKRMHLIATGTLRRDGMRSLIYFTRHKWKFKSIMRDAEIFSIKVNLGHWLGWGNIICEIILTNIITNGLKSYDTNRIAIYVQIRSKPRLSWKWFYFTIS